MTGHESLSWMRRLWWNAREIAERRQISMDEAMQMVCRGNTEQLELLRKINRDLGPSEVQEPSEG